MMSTGILGDVFQMMRQGSCSSILMVATIWWFDDVALSRCQGAGSDRQVFDFFRAEKVDRCAFGIAPAIFDAIPRPAAGLSERIDSLPMLAWRRNPRSDRVAPAARTTRRQCIFSASASWSRLLRQFSFQCINLGIALEYLETRVNKMYAIENGLHFLSPCRPHAPGW